MKKLFLSGIVTIFTITSIFSQANRTFCGSTVQTPNASTFELFKNFSSGDDCMTITNRNRSFAGKWNNLGSSTGNILMRESKRSNVNTKTNVTYSYNVKSISGNVYHGAYGWWTKFNSNGTRSNTVEFYVVEAFVSRSDPIFDMTYSGLSYNLDGGRYDVYFDEKTNQGSVYTPNDNFLQIKAVRTSSKGSGRKSGKITMKTHYDNWRNYASAFVNNRANNQDPRRNSIRKFGTRQLFEVSYVFEGFGSSSQIDFTANAGFTTRKDLDGIKNNNTTIYPNPTSGEFTIESSEATQTTVSVFDLNGKLLSQTTTGDSSVVLNSDNSLSPGLYIVSVDNGSSISTSKLVVN